MKYLYILAYHFIMAGFAVGAVRYRAVDLSELAVQSGSDIIPSVGYCINDNGMVAGHGMPVASGASSKPFVYSSQTGAFVNIGNLAGSFVDGKGGNGYSINSSGIVVGRVSVSDGTWQYRPFLFKDTNENGVVDSGENHNLGVEDGHGYGWAFSINDNNQVVGFSNNSSMGGWVWTDLNGNLEYDEGEKQYFPDKDVVAINNYSVIGLNSSAGAFISCDENMNGVYEETEIQQLPLPQGYVDSQYGCNVTIDEISIERINNSGALCGAAENMWGKANGFYWHDSDDDGVVETDEYVVFGSLGKHTHVRDMNDKSKIVGGTYEFGQNRAAFVWDQEHGMKNLNELVDDVSSDLEELCFSQAEGINNRGEIVVSGWYDLDGNGKKSGTDLEHVFVLRPYLPGDITQDSLVDMKDISVFVADYAEYDMRSDVDDDGDVDLEDLMFIAKNWLETID